MRTRTRCSWAASSWQTSRPGPSQRSQPISYKPRTSPTSRPIPSGIVLIQPYNGGYISSSTATRSTASITHTLLWGNDCEWPCDESRPSATRLKLYLRLWKRVVLICCGKTSSMGQEGRSRPTQRTTRSSSSLSMLLTRMRRRRRISRRLSWKAKTLIS